MNTTSVPKMTTTALAAWFGSNRTLASTVGRELGTLAWAGVPFCGGCCELPQIRTRTGNAGDRHRHVVNLARVVRDPDLKAGLAARLDATLFHPDELAGAQRRCLAREERFAAADAAPGLFVAPTTQAVTAADDAPDVAWAFDYFVCSWMGYGGRAGTEDEFGQTMSVRWSATGGDSCRRFRSAAESLDAWCEALRPWNFLVVDAMAFVAEAKDLPKHGLYCDPPWPELGETYRHKFDDRAQRELARVLSGFAKARVVVRYGDHPLIRELYPESRWRWVRQSSKSQAGGDVPEVLIVNGPSYGEDAA